MNIVRLHRTPADDIDEILDEAFNANFDEIIVFGIKDEEVSVYHSATTSRTRIIGALELAKYDLLKKE